MGDHEDETEGILGGLILVPELAVLDLTALLFSLPSGKDR
jgi:hypothetical protein